MNQMSVPNSDAAWNLYPPRVRRLITPLVEIVANFVNGEASLHVICAKTSDVITFNLGLDLGFESQVIVQVRMC